MSKRKKKEIRGVTPQEIIRELNNRGGALSTADLADALGIPRAGAKGLRRVLGEMVEDRKLIRYQKGRYAPAGEPEKITGQIRIKPSGFGFLDIPGDTEKKGRMIPFRNLGSARDKDTVEAVFPGPGRPGRVVKVVERGRKKIVGEIFQPDREGKWFIHPWDPCMPEVMVEDPTPDLVWKSGEIVSAEFLDAGKNRGMLVARVKERLGRKEDPRVGIEAIIAERELPVEFPEEVIREAKGMPERVSEKDLKGRVDLRGDLTMTIDPVDARDFDDAVSIHTGENGVKIVKVSIADVSHYVRERSQLDAEAFKRGTSVYLPDRVIPMLPEKLSNQICSLRPEEDSLTVTAELHYDQTGRVERSEFYPSVIHSKARLNYGQVQEVLDGKLHLGSELDAAILEMGRLCGLLVSRRRDRGSVDLNLPEAKIILDSKGEPEKIVRYPRWLSHRLIEEFMIAANEAVARHLARKGLPLIQRVHEPPDPADVEELRAFLAKFNLSLGGGETPLPKNYQDLLESIAGTPVEASVSKSCLLSLRQANYSAEKGGHYALNLNYYCHFTSPIRRYPDLEVHRILKLAQSGQKQTKRREELEVVALRSSERERVAVGAERAAVSYYGARWILKHVGEEMDGTVSGVIESGIFVQLKESLVEGFLPFHKAGPAARDMKLGDPIRVKVAGAEPERGRVDFEIVGAKQVFGTKISEKFVPKPNEKPQQRPHQKFNQKSSHKPHRGKRRR